jgi:hypothetical protein
VDILGLLADLLVTPNGTAIRAVIDTNLVSTTMPTNLGGDWFQIHFTHSHEGIAPHTHYPEVHTGSNGYVNTNRMDRPTTAQDIDFADQSIKDGRLRLRENRGDKGGICK